MAATYAGVVPILEIPSGVLADRWSRRGVLLLGNAGAFLSVLIGALSFNVAVAIAGLLVATSRPCPAVPVAAESAEPVVLRPVAVPCAAVAA